MYYELPSPDITILALFLEHSIQHIVFYKWEIPGRPPEATYNVFERLHLFFEDLKCVNID